MSINSILMGLSNLGCAAVVIAVAIPLVKGRVKMNQWYGVRIKKAFVSEDNWYKINAYGGRRVIFWSHVGTDRRDHLFHPNRSQGPRGFADNVALGACAFAGHDSGNN